MCIHTRARLDMQNCRHACKRINFDQTLYSRDSWSTTPCSYVQTVKKHKLAHNLFGKDAMRIGTAACKYEKQVMWWSFGGGHAPRLPLHDMQSMLLSLLLPSLDPQMQKNNKKHSTQSGNSYMYLGATAD